MNGYNFTERVRKVLAFAREEASRLHHEYVGTEHILLALLRETEGVAAVVLQQLGCNLDALRARVLAVVKEGRPDAHTGPDLPYTSRAKKTLELTMHQASLMHHAYVGTEHLLLGLIDEEKGIGAQLLFESGVTLEKARAETLRILGNGVSDASAASTPKRMPGDFLAAGTPFRQMRAMLEHAADVAQSAEMLPSHFTERAMDAMRDARRHASDRGILEVQPLELLLALVRQTEGAAALVFERLHIDLATLATAIDQQLRKIPTERSAGALASAAATPTGRLAESTRAAVTYAAAFAATEWRIRCGTQDLLIGVLSCIPAEEADACARAGLTVDAVRAEYRRVAG